MTVLPLVPVEAVSLGSPMCGRSSTVRRSERKAQIKSKMEGSKEEGCRTWH